MKNVNVDLKNIILIVVLSSLVFIPFLGKQSLFDWDEINFAESAREMIVTGDYLTVQINFETFWEKPPLFIWMQVASMKVFGVNEFAARFPNALCGIITFILLYLMGSKIFNREFGLFWVLVYAGSILPFFYFKLGLIDPWFNLFIFLGIFFASKVLVKEKKYINTLASALFIGLGILTKGPVALLIFGLVAMVYWIRNGFKLPVNWKQIVFFSLTVSMVGFFWFLLLMTNGHFDVVKEFIVYQIRLFETQDAGHGGFPGYHFIIALFGVFPASIFAILGHKASKTTTEYQKVMKQIMIILLWVVLILFSVVKTKIVHYSSLTYFPITFLAAFTIRKVLKGRFLWRRWLPISIVSIGSFAALLVLFFPLIDLKKEWIIEKGMISDLFAIEQFRAEINWTGWEVIGAVVLLVGLLFFYHFQSKKLKRAIIVLFASTTFFTFWLTAFFMPQIEKYTQYHFIQFFKEKSSEDAYLHCLFKSYVPLFYGERSQEMSQKSANKDYLLRGDIDKVVYFAMRNKQKEYYFSKYPYLQLIEEKDGIVYCIRQPHTKSTK